MKRLFFRSVIMMLLIPAVAGAQTTQTVRGQVCDVASGEPMIGVSITVENERNSEGHQARLRSTSGRLLPQGRKNGRVVTEFDEVNMIPS